MPFVSDKQRRFLWSQKPEVAKKFAEHKQAGGPIDMEHVKKVTQKDRYGNQVSYEFENPVKPIDQTEIIKKMMEDMGNIPEMEVGMEVPEYDHPGEPRGTDTVPAWLTPGEFVVNKEATEMYGPEIEAMNDHGREIQAAGGMEVPQGYMTGGMIPGYQEGGNVPQKLSPLLQLYSSLTGIGEVREPVEPTVWKKSPEQIAYDELPWFEKDRAAFKQEGGWITEAMLDQLAEVESGGDNEAVSPVGAIGKYQWLPKSAAQAGYGVKPFDPKDPKAARAATRKYLQNMQKYHGFTPEETLRAYNWGPGNVINYNKGKRKDIPDEALNYPRKILGVENTQGVTAPEGSPTAPPPRPGREIPVPTARPEQEGNWWDSIKGALGYQAGGDVIDDGYSEDYSNPIPIGDTSFNIPQSNISPALTDVPSGHKMFGGNQTFADTDQVVEGSNVVPPGGGEAPWYAPLLGHRSKEALNIPLDENEKRLAEEQIASSEKLAGPEIAEEENLIASDPIVQDVETDIVDSIQTEKENKFVDEIVAKKPKNESDVRNKLAVELDQTSEVDQDETAGMTQDSANIEVKGAEEAAKDPSVVEQASNVLQDTLGSLFDPKELARMAIMYAGGRALGYSHQGSIRHAAKGYIQRIDAKQQAAVTAAGTREKRAFELAKTDKFTPQSVSAYRKSGNPADLISKKATAGAVPTGTTEQRLIGGKRISIQQVKLPNGSIGYQIPGKGVVDKASLENLSKPYDASFDKGTSEYRTRRSRAVKSSGELFKEIQSREGAYKGDEGETKYSTDILPKQAAHDFWTFAESYGVDPESDEALDLMGAAYREAIAASKIEDAPRPKALKPFLEAAYIRQQTGVPQLFETNPDRKPNENAKFIRADKMEELTNSLDSLADVVPSLQGQTKTDVRNKVTATLATDWGNLSDKEKAQWNRRANEGIETGFYLFAKQQADNFLINRKLGE